MTTTQIKTTAVPEVIETLRVLRECKARLYGPDTWKKHGELISMFANVARKADRIEVLVNGWNRDRIAQPVNDTFADTVGDMAIYATMYSAWLDRNSFFSELFATPTRVANRPDRSMQHCINDILLSFKVLEGALAFNKYAIGRDVKIAHLRNIAAGCVQWLALCAKDEPEWYKEWHRSVYALQF